MLRHGGLGLLLKLAMELAEIYQCFSDRTRLRMLHLLANGPLCVCHFQEILREPQVKISKHLGYLRARGVVETRREGNFIVYALPARTSRQLALNLDCLKECVRADPAFEADLRKLRKLQQTCCKPEAELPRSARALVAPRGD